MLRTVPTRRPLANQLMCLRPTSTATLRESSASVNPSIFFCQVAPAVGEATPMSIPFEPRVKSATVTEAGEHVEVPALALTSSTTAW